MKNEQLIYGLRPVIEAIKAGREFERLFIQKNLTGQGFHELRQMLTSSQIPLQMVPLEKLNRLTKGNHQGVVGILSQIPYQNIESLIPCLFEQGKTPFLLVADRITDVRNLGALARTAECAGVDAIVVPHHETAMIHADAIKTSAGALHRIAVCRSLNLKASLMYMKESGLSLVAVCEKGSETYTSVPFTGPLALILGSEENGITPAFLRMADHICRIPMLGEIASLNVSVAGGIMMYEVVRQRSLF